MKKFISIGLILMILLGQFGMVGLAEEPTEPKIDDTVIVVKEVSTDKNTIRTDDSFQLTIKFEIKPDDHSIDDLYVQVGNSTSFSPKGSGSKVQAKDLTAKFDMYYNGGKDTKIPITITYKKDGKMLTTDDYISITNIRPQEEESKDPEDTSKIVPHLSIVGSKTITVEAGDSTYFPITVKTGQPYFQIISFGRAEALPPMPNTFYKVWVCLTE